MLSSRKYRNMTRNPNVKRDRTQQKGEKEKVKTLNHIQSRRLIIVFKKDSKAKMHTWL